VSIFIQFFCGGRRNFPQDFSIYKKRAFPPFKGIQGHSRWCKSKVRGRLPISP